MDASEKQVFAAMAIAQERFLGDKHEFDATLQAIRDWQPIRADVIRAMKAGDRETGATITKTKGAAQVKLIAERMDALVVGVKYRAANFAESATETGSQARTMVTSALVVMIILGGLIAWAITHGVRGPISKLRVVMERLAKQDYLVEVPFTANTNEIGQIAKAVEFFKENGLAVEHLRNEQARMKAEGEALRKKQILDLADDFESHVKAVVEHVASAATEMSATASSMSAVAEQATRQSSAAASAADEASGNVQDRGIAAEELSVSITEIGQQVTQASETSRDAVIKAERTNRDRRRPVRCRGEDRHGRQPDQRHRQPDQPAGAQRHDRGGAGRRGRQGLRHRRSGSQGPGQPDRQGDRGNRQPDIRPCRAATGQGVEGHSGHQRQTISAVSDRFRRHRVGGRGADAPQPGDRPQCRAGRPRHPGGFVQHFRTSPKRRTRRAGSPIRCWPKPVSFPSSRKA